MPLRELRAVAAAAMTVVFVVAMAAGVAEATEPCPEQATTVVIQLFEDQCTVMTPVVQLEGGEAVKFVNKMGQEVIIDFGESSPFTALKFGLQKDESACYASRSATELGLSEKDGVYSYTAKPKLSTAACRGIGDAQPRIVVRASSGQPGAEGE
jgi:hypothetical protein